MTAPDPGYSSASYTPDRLIGGHFPLVTREITLTDNQTVGALTRGAVIGRHTDGTYAVVHQTGNYAAAKARGILAKDADPSGGDVQAIIYLAGEFNEDKLSFGGTIDADGVRDVLDAVGIYLKSPVSA